MSLIFKPIWFDSMGAKSTCTLIKTPDISIVIDPGVAIMQPSFPATEEQKNIWLNTAVKTIKSICKEADIITISHYHHDHYFHDDLDIYNKKTVFVKNPNEYINDNQRVRGEEFIRSTINHFSISENELVHKNKKSSNYPNPLDDLKISKSKDFGDYNKRRKEVLEKGYNRFEKRVKNWEKYEYLPEINSKEIQLIYPEGNTYTFNDTKITFTKPLFHGIEFAGVGWIFAIIIQYKEDKVFHSSDISGPMIEDYAEIIIKEKPTYLFLDGPTTYLFGYILNRINLNRCIENTINILKKTNCKTIIYDHHITREKNYITHTKEIWDTAKKLDKKLVTAAEYLGKKPVVLVD